MAQFTEQDHILLNSYIDGRLDPAERADFEARLAADFALRTELEQLRDTVGLLRMAERVRVPRSFTLDPAVYGKPEPRSLWERLGLANMPGWAVATASLLVVVICIGVLIVNGRGAGQPASVAEAPQAFLAGNSAPAATEAPTEAAMAEAMTEAPTEAGTAESFAAQLATEAPAAAVTALSAPTMLPDTTAAKSAPSLTPNDMTPPGGMGGGPPGGAAGGGPGNDTAAQEPSQPPAPLATRDLVSGAAPTQVAGGQPLSSGPAADSARGAAPAPTEEATVQLYGTLEVTEAPVFQGLGSAGWAILLGGTLGLIVVVLGVTFLMRRRR